MSNDFEARKRYFRNSIGQNAYFRYNRMGHKKMKLFCTQYARPSRHCFKKNVYLFANDDKTMLRIFSVFLQKTSWNTSGGFL